MQAPSLAVGDDEVDSLVRKLSPILYHEIFDAEKGWTPELEQSWNRLLEMARVGQPCTAFDRRVLDYVRERKSLRLSEIGNNFRYTPSKDVWTALERLERAGLIRRERSGKTGRPRTTITLAERVEKQSG